MVPGSHTKARAGCQTLSVLHVPVADSWPSHHFLPLFPTQYLSRPFLFFPFSFLPFFCLSFHFLPFPLPSFSFLYNLAISAMHFLGSSPSLVPFSLLPFLLSHSLPLSFASLVYSAGHIQSSTLLPLGVLALVSTIKTFSHSYLWEAVSLFSLNWQ